MLFKKEKKAVKREQYADFSHESFDNSPGSPGGSRSPINSRLGMNKRNSSLL
jgi:hypothetical protein